MILGVVVVALIPARRVRERLAEPPEEVSLVETASHAL
jgi:hypothetical protein